MKRTLSAGILTATVGVTLLSNLLPLSHAEAVEKVKRVKTRTIARKSPRAATPDPRTVALLRRVEAAYREAATLTADFTYAVTSVKRQQVVEGTIRVKRPNLARVTYSNLHEPAFPSLIGSDGRTIYTFTPNAFDTTTRRFRTLPFDSQLGAKQASGLEPGGGTITQSPVSTSGSNLRLWDATPVQAFFDPLAAIHSTLFIEDPKMLTYEGKQTINGITYQVLRHHYSTGNIAGGETSPFEQRLFIGPDYLIHQYVLEFRSGGRPGVQVARLRNIRVNVPMDSDEFKFTPPQEKQ